MGVDPRDTAERRRARQRGLSAEDRVADLLTDDGWQVRARNWIGGGGELDLVVSRDGVWRIVEVKARAPGDPEGLDAIDPAKQRKLRQAAEAWLQEQEDLLLEVAFLVVLVEGERITLLDDAF